LWDTVNTEQMPSKYQGSTNRPLPTTSLRTHRLTERVEKAAHLQRDLELACLATMSGCWFMRWLRIVVVLPLVDLNVLLQCMQIVTLETAWSSALRKWCQTSLLGWRAMVTVFGGVTKAQEGGATQPGRLRVERGGNKLPGAAPQELVAAAAVGCESAGCIIGCIMVCSESRDAVDGKRICRGSQASL
jgi:hypothetical protein